MITLTILFYLDAHILALKEILSDEHHLLDVEWLALHINGRFKTSDAILNHLVIDVAMGHP